MKRELYEVVTVEDMNLQPAMIYTALIGGRIPMVVQYLPDNKWKSVPIDGKEIPKGVTHILQPILKSEGRGYWFKGKPYLLLCESKIKMTGIMDNTLGLGEHKSYMLNDTDEWIEVVIYMCLYENPDGMIWVREKNEFYEKFKPNR